MARRGRHNRSLGADAVAFGSIEGSTIMHSISTQSQIRVTGPLAPFSSALAEELATLGYASTSATTQLQLAAHLSRWLQARGLGPDGLTGPVIAEFLVERRRGHSHLYSLQALDLSASGYLRRVGVAPAAEARVPVGAVEELLAGSPGLLARRALGHGPGR